MRALRLSGSSNRDARYSTIRWQRLRLRVIARDGRRCAVAGCRSDMNKPGAVHVDHITEAKDGLANFWDPANLQVLCKKHHGAKTLTVAAGRADPRSPNA